MARSAQSSGLSEPLRITVSRSRAEQVIDRHIGEGQSLQADSDQVVTEEHYNEWDHRRERWVNLTADGLRSIYSNDEPPGEFERAAHRQAYVIRAGEEFELSKGQLDTAINTLKSLRERLEYLESPAEAADVAPDRSPSPAGGDRIFVVHGHADDVKEAVGRLLEKTGDHEIVILHEQPSEGRTLIEKFEDHADASAHAVVLLTADDVGGAAPKDSADPRLHSRARQNVVFELGFFVGRLGRSRVVVLYEEGVELPSDFKGVVYLSLADDSWRYKLLKELQSAGLTYDLNKIPT